MICLSSGNSLLNELAQRLTGTYFDECVNAALSHSADCLFPENGMIYLRLHGFNHVLVRSSVSVCVYRRHGRLDIAGAKERTEFFRRFVHEGGVESTADSERNNSSAGFGEFRFSIIQGFLCSRYRNLTGAVVVDGVGSAGMRRFSQQFRRPASKQPP